MAWMEGERRPLLPQPGQDEHGGGEASPALRNAPRGCVAKVLATVTVEPLMLLYIMGYGVGFVYLSKMWVDKTCLFHFGFTPEECQDLDSGRYPDEQKAVQRMTARYHQYNHLLEYLPAALVVLVLGKWSDTRGRRLPLLLPLVGMVVMALALVANAIWWTLPPEYLLLAYVPAGVTGAGMTVFMGCYSYITVASGHHSRTTRISAMVVVVMVAATSGQALGALIYSHWGYVGVFGVQAGLVGAAVVYGLVRLEDRPEDEGNELRPTMSVMTLLSPVELWRTLTTPFKTRPGTGRRQILGHIAIILIYMVSYGTLNFNYLYSRYKFSWDYQTYTLWSMVDTGLQSIGPLCVVPVLSYYGGVGDVALGLLGAVSMALNNVIKGNTPSDQPWIMYLASAMGCCQGVVLLSSRSAISKLVRSGEVGAVFAVLGAGEAGVPALSAVVYTSIYNGTLEPFPGTIYLFTATLAMLICCIYGVVNARCSPDSPRGPLGTPHA